MAKIFDATKWTCEVCGKVVAPIFGRVQVDNSMHWYCGDHDPISREEFEQRWGITPEMKEPRKGRGRRF